MTSEVVTTGTFFSAAVVPAVVDLELFDLLLNFSPLPAITNSVLFNSLRCLLRMKNQKPTNEARRTTATGTTIAGIKVLRLLDDFEDDVEEEEDAAAAVLDADGVTFDILDVSVAVS